MIGRIASLVTFVLASAAPSLARAEAPREMPAKEPEHFRIGVLGGVGFPRPLSIEAIARIERTVALGVEYGAMPAVTISGARTTFSAFAGDVRVMPFRNAFFFGVRVGRQHLGADATVTVASYGSFPESIEVDSWFVNPRVGFLWVWDSGLSLGLDAGVQIPFASTSSSTLPSGYAATDSITRVTDAFGRGVLPTIDLLRIGLMF